MVRLIVFIFFALALFRGPSAVADVGSVIFDSQALICTAANLARENSHLRSTILARLTAAPAIRNRLASEATGGDLIQTRIAKSLLYHSLQLIAPVSGESQAAFAKIPDLWSGMAQVYSDAKAAKPVPSLVDERNILIKISKSSNPYFPSSDDAALDLEYELRFHIQSQVLLNFLMVQPKASLTPADLLARATSLYNGDMLTALGVIGHSFDKERMMTTTADGAVTSRNRLTVLGSKVKPLYAPTENPYGNNYHFWAYLNMSLQGSVVSERIFNLVYESWAQASDESRIDLLGMKVGAEIRRKILANEGCM